MTGTAITISEAARRLGLKQQEASLLIRASDYVPEPSPYGGNAKLLDDGAVDYLAKAARNLGRTPIAPAE